MSKQVYISADYDQLYGDRNVVEELNKWGSDSLHKVDFIDMSKVSSGTVANGDDCRICDLKAEFNETDINPPAELGRLADASGDKRSTRI